MGSVQIHLGKTRLRRRRALAHNEYAGVDPFGRPNFLYLTDSQRKRQLVEREFVERREGGVFAPEVSTVSAFLDGLWRRFGDGRAQWTVTAVAMVAHRLLTAAASRWPWFARLGTGPTVVAEITRAHRAWDEAGMPELAAPAELPGFLQE